MRSRSHLVLWSTAVAGALVFAACQKNSTSAGAEPAKVVKEAERSKHFTAVNQQLELGGTLYGYVDIDGDVLKLMGGVQALVAEIGKTQPQLATLAEKDYVVLAKTLGLADVKAIGVSSVAESDGYFRNRMFFYTGGERNGLLAGLGGKPAAISHLKHAPADTAFYAETEIDVPAVYRTIKEVVSKVAGEPVGNQFEAQLKKSGEQVALSVLDLIYGLKGHSSIVLRFDPAKPVTLPVQPEIKLPGASFLLSIDGVAPIVEPMLAKLPLQRVDLGAIRMFTVPMDLARENFSPLLIVDGTTLRLASSFEFYGECIGASARLAQNPEFQTALAAVGPEGNGLVYVSPKFPEGVRQIEALNPGLPPQAKNLLRVLLGAGAAQQHPLVAVRSNLTDGILVRSHWDRSLKQDMAMMTACNPVAVGLFAAMAIPAFQKVRSTSQEKAVLNNLRMLAAAADQYYLENGVRTATFDQVVGPTRYVKALNSVTGEDYRTLRFVQGQPLRVQLPDGRVVQFPPGAVEAQPPQLRGLPPPAPKR